MNRVVLVIVAHSDDEALGCGGTIARHAREGDEVHLVILTDGVGARQTTNGDNAASRRQKACDEAARILGIKSVMQFNFPDNQMDSIPLLSVTRQIETVAKNVQPDIVYTHHSGDLNIDHQICNRAVLTTFRPFPGQTARAIFGFEVASATGWLPGGAFEPQHFVDITETIEIKMAALRAYSDEMRESPHVRSYDALQALARWRGALVGVNAAEAFYVLRQVN